MIEKTARPRPVSRLRPLLAALALICLMPRLSTPVYAIESDRVENCRPTLTPAEETLLSLTLAESAPEATYAARVGMAAAVLGRMRSPAYPDALPDVLDGLRAEGAFGKNDAAPSFYAGIPAALTRALGDRIADLGRIVGTGVPSDERLAELSLHAVRAAEAGADPAGGALSFRIVRIPRSRDFFFNDAGEDTRKKKIADALRDCPLVLGEVGFR